MAAGDPYLTVSQFKNRSQVGLTDSSQDASILEVLQAATEQVNRWCGRVFWKTASEIRYYSQPCGPLLEVDDIAVLSELALDNGSGGYETIVDAVDYLLNPRNAANMGRPYRTIQLRQFGTHAWPYGIVNGIRVTGEFGWPAVPAPIKEATFLFANRERSLWTAPFGVSGNAEAGALEMSTSITPVIKALLAGYRVKTL